jgi:hypothetical protein
MMAANLVDDAIIDPSTILFWERSKGKVPRETNCEK